MAFLPPPAFEIPRQPVEPPLHGLQDTAYEPDLSLFPESERDRWEAGISFSPNPSTCADHVAPWMAWTDDPEDKDAPGANVAYSVYNTFVLTFSEHCQAVPGKELDARVKAAMDNLVAGSGQAVESVFWGPGSAGPLAEMFYPTGENFSLSGNTPLVTGFGANACTGILNRDPTSSGIVSFSPKQALLSLTQALGNCALGARGFIHAPIYLVEDWAEQGLIRLEDPTDTSSKYITNIRGDYIVGGSGYSGVGPDGHPLEIPADGFSWAYATGPVGVLLSEPRSAETTIVDHKSNIHRILVERTVAIAANSSCLFAAYTDVA